MKRTALSALTILLAVSAAYAAILAFHAFSTVPCGVNPRGLAVGDVTGDGVPDLAVANFGARTFIGHDTPQTVLDPQSCVLQVFSPSSAGLVLRDSVHTNFSPRGVAVVDLDGRGGAEVLVTTYDAGKLQTYTWNEGRLHQVEENPSFDKPVGVAAAPLRAGWPVVVAVANFSSNKVSLLAADAHGKLKGRVDVPVNAGPVQVSIGDVDGDGVREIVAACIDAHKLDVIGLPADLAELDLTKASVRISLDVPAGSEPADLEAADLDGDGRVDVATCNFIANTLSVFMQGPDGMLSARPVVGTGGNRCNGMTVGDLDRDGVMECVVANRDSDLVAVFRAEGAGNYVLDDDLKVADEKDTNLGPIEAAVLDANLDGTPDVVVSHMRSNSLRVLLRDVPRPTPTVEPAGAPLSSETTLAYPNPSKGKTRIKFTLMGPADVMVQIFDLMGVQVWSTLIPAGATRRGENELTWGAVSLSQAPVASGTYMVTLSAEGKSVTKKVMIIR
jgi:hypothetical protein